MREVPAGWRFTTLGRLGNYLNGRGFKKSEWRDIGRPIIRIQNLTGSNAAFNYFDGDADERHIARSGDLLVSWAATLGAFIWNGPEAVVNQHIFKVESNIDLKFHKHLLDFKLEELKRQTHGSGMVHITRGKFDSLPVAVPESLEEQRRIVDILEDHLSRLDAATRGVNRSLRRLGSYEAAALSRCRDGGEHLLGEVTEIQGGIQKQPKRAPRENAYPFLRVANVMKEGLSLVEVHCVELFEGELDRLRLRPGDLLVVEGNGSASQIGRAALWDGSVDDCVHQNHLIRVRPKDGLSAAYLEALWNSPQNRWKLTNLASSSSGLHTLSVSKLKGLKLPIPTLDRQQELVAELQDVRGRCRRLGQDLDLAASRAVLLRRALLSAAFTGRLTGRSSDMDRVEEMAGV